MPLKPYAMLSRSTLKWKCPPRHRDRSGRSEYRDARTQHGTQVTSGYQLSVSQVDSCSLTQPPQAQHDPYPPA
eukprot:3464290-Prymnesium_polylepis.1